jgi:hypothetical protein
MSCLICGKETKGSVGKAGLKWIFICQTCKDEEDRLLEEKIKYQKKITDEILKEVK